MKYRDFKSVHNEMDDDSKENEELVSNIVIMGVSMLLLGLVSIAFLGNISGSKTESNLKNLNAVCAKTEAPESCLHVLKHVGERATVLDYIKAAINATLEELLVVDMPKPYLERILTPLQEQSYRDCLELLNMGKDELESLSIMVNSSTEYISTIDPNDFVNSLSAILSYQQICSNELAKTSSFEILGYSLKLPILLTRITLAIVDSFFEKPIFIEGRQLQGSRKWLDSPRHKEVQETRIVVAQNGSGHFTTITESLNHCAENKMSSCVIYVTKGIYEERVVVPKNLDQVLMYGDGPLETIVTGINTRDSMMISTPIQSATFVVKGKGFIWKDMGFIAPANITGAPALLVLSDHAAFYNCNFDGEEGTLYAAAQRQFYRDCEIRGSLDIIKGDSTTIIQNSKIIVKPQNSSNLVLRKNVVSAQSRLDKHERTGLVIQNCTIIAEQGEIDDNSLVGSTCLGIPRNEYSRTIIMESFLGDVIHQKGWCKWSDNYGIDTATFIEYNNRGPGASYGKRVHWESYRKISENQKDEIKNFTASEFIQADKWLLSTGIPYESGIFFH